MTFSLLRLIIRIFLTVLSVLSFFLFHVIISFLKFLYCTFPFLLPTLPFIEVLIKTEQPTNQTKQTKRPSCCLKILTLSIFSFPFLSFLNYYYFWKLLGTSFNATRLYSLPNSSQNCRFCISVVTVSRV